MNEVFSMFENPRWEHFHKLGFGELLTGVEHAHVIRTFIKRYFNTSQATSKFTTNDRKHIPIATIVPYVTCKINKKPTVFRCGQEYMGGHTPVQLNIGPAL